MARRRAKKPGLPPRRAEPAVTVADRVRDAGLGALAAVAIVAVAQSVLFTASPVALLAPIAGIAAALAVRRPGEAALVALTSTFLGVVAAAAISRAPWESPSAWVPQALGIAALAAVIAFATAWAGLREPRLPRVAPLVALALFIVAMWVAGVELAYAPAKDGSTFVGVLSSPAPLSPTSSDEDIYLHYIQRLRRGEPYYPAAASTLREANSFHERGIDLGTPLSYRPPTLYWILSRLPGGAPSILYAGLLWASLAAVAAFALGRGIIPPAFRLLSAAIVGTYLTNVATTVTLVQTEWWAGVLGLDSLALLLNGGRKRSAASVWAAATFALMAALVRELAAPFLLLGLVAMLLDPDARARRLWVPWAVALAAAALAFTAHWSAASAVIRGLRVASASANTWFHPDGRGLLSAVRRIALMLTMRTGAAWVVLGLGVAGGFLGGRDRTSRLLLIAVAGIGPLLLAFLYPSGTDLSGSATSYWADIVLPTALASAPLALALLPSRYALALRGFGSYTQYGSSAR